MARFTLAIRPDGRAILATASSLPGDELTRLREIVKGWDEGQWPVLVVPDCEVVQVAEIEVDVDAAAAL